MNKLRAFLIVAILCSGFVIYLLWAEPFTPDIQRVERLLRAQMPTRATEVKSRFINGFQDDSFYLRLDLPADEFPGFIGKLCPEGEAVFNTEYNVWATSRHPALDWWITPNTPISVSATCFNQAAGVYMEVFVDETNKDLYRIFITGGQP